MRMLIPVQQARANGELAIGDARLEASRLTAVRTRPVCTVLVLVLVDMTALVFCSCVSVYLRKIFEPTIDPGLYWSLWPVLALFLGGYSSQRLYGLVGRSPAEELRRQTLATTFVFVGVAASSFIFRGGELYSRGAFLIAWALSLFLAPLFRAGARFLFAKRAWWGQSVVVLGAGTAGIRIVKTLTSLPELGLKPIAVFDDNPDKRGAICGIPIVGGLVDAEEFAKTTRLSYAILAMPNIPHERLLKIVERHTSMFSHLIVIPDLFGFASLRVPAQDLGGILGLEVRQELLLPLPRTAKRIMDLVVTIIGGILIFPFLLMVILLIKLDSRGPVFYSQERPGRFGKAFKIFKFRTMHVDADERFQKLPAELISEFNKFGKIKNDPRVTRIGRFLRKFSIDELPQLWNVVLGDLSLVGPRPYLNNQVAGMGESDSFVFKVVPGLTGLWQVSGRSALSFDDRVQLDTYYVRNWSLWLDIWILAKTIPVLLGEGAY